MATYAPSYDHESNGTWAATNDPVSYPATPPSYGIFGSGYHGPHLGVMSTGLLSDFQNDILYTDDFLDAHVNARVNPLTAIMKCHKLPFTVPGNVIQHEETNHIALNGETYNLSGNMWYLLEQWRRIDCGYVDIPLYFDGFMDMAPYTKIQVYLPFIGFQEINPVLCVGGRIGIIYMFNMCTGDCIAHVGCTDKNGVRQVITSPTGNAALSTPITGANDLTKWNIASAILGGAVDVAAAYFSGGLSVGAATGLSDEAISSVNHVLNIANQVARQEGVDVKFGNVQSPDRYAAKAATVARNYNTGMTAAQGVRNAVSSGLNTPITSGSVGDITGSNGAMACRTPFVMISRPHYCIPENYASQYGYPSNITDTIANFQGYLEVGSVHLDSIVATASEKAEIDALLRSGVIVPRTSSS